MVTETRKREVKQIPLITSKVFEAILDAYLTGKRRICLEGGTAATKTFSSLQALILIAKGSKEPLLISIVSESLPHLRRGAMRDFFRILGETEDDNTRWSKTLFAYTFNSGVKIEFFGTDDEGKVRGPRRDMLFINEGNNISWNTALGLDVRTSRFTIVDWNPVSQFWAHENWIGQPENAYNHSTYLDAKDILPQSIIQTIEARKDKDPNWWNIYGLGLLGKVDNLVYPRFEQVDKLPEGNKEYGLDFGYLVDPTTLVANVIIGDKLYSQEIFYEHGLSNDMISRKMDLLKIPHNNRIIADADEPKSIDELVKMGWNVVPSVKGHGSVEYTHQKVNQYYQYWTKDSVNCIKEQRNFMYLKNREGILTDKTAHQWSHGLSARRYCVAGYIPTIGKGGIIVIRR